MQVKLAHPERVYYDKEQKLTLTGKKVFKDVKVTQYIRGQLNAGSLLEVLDTAISDEDKAKIIAEAKADEEAKIEAARVAALTPAQKKAEDKAKADADAKKLAADKAAAEAAAKKTETA